MSMSQPLTLYYPDFEPPLEWLRTFLLFHKNIARIVPTDVVDFETDDFKRFREAFPEAIIDIPSTSDLIELDQVQRDRLDKAFGKIAENMTISDEVSLNLTIIDGGISFPGFAFLHRSKVSHSVHQLLIKHQLAPDFLQDVAAGFDISNEVIVVDDKAANLILSLLADRVARDNGFDTVTSSLIDYSLLAVNGMGVSPCSGSVPGGSSNKLLASTILTAQVPQHIADIPLDEYGELRKEYSDLQEPFQRIISEQAALARIDRIANPELIAQHINKAASDFSLKLERIQRKRKLSYIKRFSPYVVAGLIELTNPLQFELKIALTLAAVTVVVEGIERAIPTADPDDKELAKIRRSLFGLQRRLAFRELGQLVRELL